LAEAVFVFAESLFERAAQEIRDLRFAICN